MSGGHYNYIYTRLIDMAEHIGEDLEDKELCISDDTRDLMKLFRTELYHTARKAKVLEWVMSGDYSEDAFKDAMDAPFNPEITENDVWGA